MIKTLLFILLLFYGLAGPVWGAGLNEIKSSDQLARFIYEMVIKEEVPAGRLLNGIRSPVILRIPGYEVEIPVREIFGTIVEERFTDKLNRQLFDNDVRAICAFRNSKDEVWRFHIIIFKERQYKLMEQFLERIMKE
ncbi:MAG: hypothetical protein HY607_10940 [Planctomycetes bacterium]|uniref:hypothetical protein n=1 Tax=Candidatus Wunengus californicus TaxID=3367619 RepID=UPI0040286B33|nr:hypothetical protein [Planctomycetota bacterium]MBI4223177.1 hypothetical protein [Planctomycetota bacterium]